MSLRDLQKKPFGSHSLSLPQKSRGWEEAGDQTSSHLLLVSYTPQQHPQVERKPRQVWDETTISSFWQNIYFLEVRVFLSHLGCFWWWNWDCSASLGPADSWSNVLGWGRLCPPHWRSGSPEVKRKRDRDRECWAISRDYLDFRIIIDAVVSASPLLS